MEAFLVSTGVVALGEMGDKTQLLAIVLAAAFRRPLAIIAGIFILLSLALGIPGSPVFVNTWWLAFTAFVGANLLQSGFTKWCLMESILRKLGVKPGC